VAYLRQLEHCPCGRVATVELVGLWNVSYGKFCDGCGKRRLRDLQANEAMKRSEP
jgi:hypothetical protein